MSVNSCINCAHAVWARTKNGHLHPNQEGRCTWTLPPIPIPLAFNYSYGKRTVPSPSGGYINRIALYFNCPCWEPKSEENGHEPLRPSHP